MLGPEPQPLPMPESDKVPASPDQPSVETEEQVTLPQDDVTMTQDITLPQNVSPPREVLSSQHNQPLGEEQQQQQLSSSSKPPRKKKVRVCGSTGPTLDSRQTWCEKQNGHLGECGFTGGRYPVARENDGLLLNLKNCTCTVVWLVVNPYIQNKKTILDSHAITRQYDEILQNTLGKM